MKKSHPFILGLLLGAACVVTPFLIVQWRMDNRFAKIENEFHISLEELLFHISTSRIRYRKAGADGIRQAYSALWHNGTLDRMSELLDELRGLLERMRCDQTRNTAPRLARYTIALCHFDRAIEILDNPLNYKPEAFIDFFEMQELSRIDDLPQ